MMPTSSILFSLCVQTPPICFLQPCSYLPIAITPASFHLTPVHPIVCPSRMLSPNSGPVHISRGRQTRICGSVACFVTKVLRKHIHTHSFMYRLEHIQQYNLNIQHLDSCNKDSMARKANIYYLALHKKNLAVPVILYSFCVKLSFSYIFSSLPPLPSLYLVKNYLHFST